MCLYSLTINLPCAWFCEPAIFFLCAHESWGRVGKSSGWFTRGEINIFIATRCKFDGQATTTVCVILMSCVFISAPKVSTRQYSMILS